MVNDESNTAAEAPGDVEEFRGELVEKLPHLLSRALKNYRRFTEAQAPADIKTFTAHQAACRGALLHLHLLIRLTKWAAEKSASSSGPFDQTELARLVEEAEAEIGRDI